MPDLKLPAVLASSGRRTIGGKTGASTPFFEFGFNSREERRTVGGGVEESTEFGIWITISAQP